MIASRPTWWRPCRVVVLQRDELDPQFERMVSVPASYAQALAYYARRPNWRQYPPDGWLRRAWLALLAVICGDRSPEFRWKAKR